MPSYVSPGVYTLEKDLSQYPPSINSSIVGLVGFASKGPVNKATLITSPQQLVDTFGKPHEDIYGQALEGALEILETTNAIYFIRAAVSSESTDASALMQFAGCPFVAVSGSDDHFAEAEGHSGYGVSSNLYLKINGADEVGNKLYTSDKEFSILSSLSDDLSTEQKLEQGEFLAFRKVFGGELDSGVIGSWAEANYKRSPYIVNPFAGSGAYLDVKAYTDSSFSTGIAALRACSGAGPGVLGDNVWTSSCRVYGLTYDKADTAGERAGYMVQSLHPGGAYNLGTRSDGTTSGNSIETGKYGNQNFSLAINEDGVQAEAFKMSFVGSGAFITDVLNTTDLGTNNKSNFVIGNLVSSTTDNIITGTKLQDFTETMASIGFTGATAKWGGARVDDNGTSVNKPATTLDAAGGAASRFIKLIQGTTGLTGGSNGIGTVSENNTALIGDATVEPKTGMQALDDDVLNISLACVPGITDQTVQNSLITLAEKSQNFFSLVSAPYGIGTVQDAIAWSNGQNEARTTAINSSYAATFWPWVKVFSPSDGKDVWYDPAIFGIRQMTFTDSIADPWFAPAGFTRGRLTKPTDLEVSLNQGDRDTMYSGGNVVNPIQKWPQQGIMLWGQRTMKRTPSALDRINVRRLMIYVRKLILASTREFVFEPNDTFTWDRIVAVLSPALLDIQQRRGIIDFAVICDSSTNTPLRIDRNELWTKVLIKPTKTAEMLVFEVNLTSQGATLS